MTTTKHPWTHWAISIYSGAILVMAFLLWVLGISPPKSSWFLIVLWVPLFVLWWKDGLKRADADFDCRMQLIKVEVRRAVQAELNKGKKGRDVVEVALAGTTGTPTESHEGCGCVACRSGHPCVKAHLLGLKGKRT